MGKRPIGLLWRACAKPLLWRSGAKLPTIDRIGTERFEDIPIAVLSSSKDRMIPCNQHRELFAKACGKAPSEIGQRTQLIRVAKALRLFATVSNGHMESSQWSRYFEAVSNGSELGHEIVEFKEGSSEDFIYKFDCEGKPSYEFYKSVIPSVAQHLTPKPMSVKSIAFRRPVGYDPVYPERSFPDQFPVDVSINGWKMTSIVLGLVIVALLGLMIFCWCSKQAKVEAEESPQA